MTGEAGEPMKYEVVPFDDIQLHKGEHEDYGESLLLEVDGKMWCVVRMEDGRIALGKQVME